MVTLLQRISGFGTATALLDESGKHTFTDLDRASRRIATGLSQTFSGATGRRVALLLVPGFEYVATLWGIWRAGGTAVPLCPSHPLSEMDYVLGDSGSDLVVVQSRHQNVLSGTETDCQILPVRELLNPRKKEESEYLPPKKAAALILYTSGSTGRPKGVVLSHANLEAQIRMLVSAWGWSAEDRILHVLPLHHTHGLINALLCPLWCGAVCEFLPRFDPPEVWKHLTNKQVTVFMGVPTIYAKLLGYREKLSGREELLENPSCSHLRLMVSGSAPLSVKIFNEWRATTGQILLERYGMTETGMALSNPLKGVRRPGFVGKPLPGVQIRRVDDEGDVIDCGEVAGEIEVRGPSVFCEYWKRPQETTETFHNGWFRTGDVAVIKEGFWKILGRRSVDIIKTGGHKVSALEIENVLLRHPSIRECAVIGVTDSVWGQKVCAVVTLKRQENLNLKELRNWTKHCLAAYKAPTHLEIVESLPRNVMGKVVKRVLSKMLSGEAPSLKENL